MKTLPIVLVAALLAACSASAQTRIGGFSSADADPGSAKNRAARQQQMALDARRRPNTAIDGPWPPVENVLRRAEGKLVDLRPFWYWKEAGTKAWAAYQPFSVPDPLPDWSIITGKVQFVGTDGDVVVSRGSELPVFLRNWPDRTTAQTDTLVSVLARKLGTRNATVSLGAGKTLALYDYGELATAEEVAALGRQEAEVRASAQEKAKAAAAEADAKRKADIAARVEKSRADRAAKEAKEKLEVK